ncbi:hypothetical protein TSMEX_003009 [Taenia solium]|eukprot:TsM_000493200 transcript=TsM_000493200 gene=TsM_000493200
MRLVAHRQSEDSKTEEGATTSSEVEKTPKKDAISLPSASEWKDRKMDEGEKKKNKEEEPTVDDVTPSLSSSTASPCNLDRQGSLDQSSQNHSSTTSESFATQVHRPEASAMVLERADTVPSDSTPLSSSTTPPSSPNPEVNLVTRSAIVDPPSDFADTPSPQKDIYFPYLSKVRNLDQDGCGQEPLYQPLRFDKPTRDPFVLPSRLQELSISVNQSCDSVTSYPAKTSVAELARWPNESVVKAPLCVDKSSLLLRHGYTPHRNYDSAHVQSQLDEEAGIKENNEVGPRPTVVRAGCAPPAEEPIIVAEYYVPLGDVSQGNLS